MLRRPSGMTLAIVGLGAAIAVGIAWPYLTRPTSSPASAAPQAGPPFTLRGLVTLIATNNLNYDIPNVGRGCSGQGGYSDLTSGRQITVSDATGKVIGVGQLSYGRAESEVTCRFPFEVKGLPAADFYGIELQRRGTLRYPIADLKARNWEVAFTLGQ
jgi:hypothetical protein